MKELVLFIHGTNSNDPSDVGSIWWQRGSELMNAISETLGEGFDCQPAGHVFHWSGANSETERRAAGEELSKWLRRFEKEGQPYHLIGHSHGGSVMWHAFRRIIESGETLSLLRSWTTVGTPFLHFLPRRMSWWWALPLFVVIAFATMSAAPVISYVRVIDDALHDPGASPYPLLALPLLWAIPVAVCAAAAVRLATFLNAWRRVRVERHAATRAYADLWQRYLGLWCDVDEAIGGLASTLTIPLAIVPRMRAVPASTPGRVLSALAAPFRRLYNALLAQASDEFIWDRVSSRLQGSDRFAYHLTLVTRGPLDSVSPWPEIPEQIGNRIVATANEYAATTLAKVRNVLGLAAEARPGMHGFVAGVTGSLSDKELVHNLYFSDRGVVNLLGEHITGNHSDEWLREGRTATQPGEKTPGTSGAHQLAGGALAAMQALAATALLTAGWGLAALMYSSFVKPHLPRTQIESIIGENPTARIISGPDISEYPLRRWAAALTVAGFADNALAIAAELKKSSSRLFMMASVAHELLVKGDAARAHAILNQALEVVVDSTPEFGTPEFKHEAFIAVAEELAHAGRDADALKVIDLLDRGLAEWKDEGLREVASGYADSGRVRDAIATLNSIPDLQRRAAAYVEFLRVRVAAGERLAFVENLRAFAPNVSEERNSQSSALSTVANEYAKAGSLPKALELARAIQQVDTRSSALVQIAMAYIDRRQFVVARKVIDEALKLNPKGGTGVARALIRLHAQTREAGDQPLIRKMLENARVEATRLFPELGSVLVAETWAEAGDVSRTIELLTAIPLGSNKHIVFKYHFKAVERLAGAGKTKATEDAIRSVKDVTARCFLLIALAGTLEEQPRRAVLLETEKLAAAIDDDDVRSFAFAAIAKQWAQMRQYRYAVAMSERTRSFDRLDVYTTLLEHYAGPRG